MNPALRWLLVALLASPLAYAQDNPPSNTPAEEEEKREFSFTITPRVVEGILGKMADETANRYGFDEDQKYQTREIFRERIAGWLANNQDDIQNLMSGYFEGLLADEAPDARTVGDWASQIRPLAEDFKHVMIDMSDEMGEYMTEDQLVQKEGEIAALETMFTFLDQRLGHWEEGGWDPVIDHPTGTGFEGAERERQKEVAAATEEAREEIINSIYEGRTNPFGEDLKRVRQKEPTSGKDPVDNDPWSKYVRDFVKKYDLNEAQTNQCDRILRKMQEDRDNYLRRVDPRILEIENRLTETPEGAAKDRLVAEYERLAKPIETKFTLLQQRLTKIPTRAQRLKAQAKQENAKTPVKKVD